MSNDIPQIIILKGPLSLTRMQEIVGGYIEIIPKFNTWNGEKCVAICDEEAKIKGKPVNALATNFWYDQYPQIIGHDVLTGDILIVTGRFE